MKALRRAAATVALTALVAAAAASTAAAQDPGRWLLTGASSVPVVWYQGLTSNPAKTRTYFVGVFEGVWQATPRLLQTGGVGNAIPPAVATAEGYNHIGDPTWNRAEGGRLILPLECYRPGAGGNTCGTGSFGVTDPRTLAWRYYVKLDRSEIAKAMWAETSPDGRLIWTSSGSDLLAYRTSDVSAANAAPAAAPIRSVRRLAGAVPPTGVTGAVFRAGRLLLAGERDGVYQVWSVDTATGSRRLELETTLCGEAEGLDTIPTLGGRLHWLIAPFDPGCQLSFGPSSALLHFVRTPGRAGLNVSIANVVAEPLPGRVTAVVRVMRGDRPVRRAYVSFAGGKARTGKRGFAVVRARLALPGRFSALARKGPRYGLSPRAEVATSQAARASRVAGAAR